MRCIRIDLSKIFPIKPSEFKNSISVESYDEKTVENYQIATFLNLVESNQIWIVTKLSDRFSTKRNSVWCQINRKRVITIQIRFDSTIFGKKTDMHFRNLKKLNNLNKFCLSFGVI